MMRRYEVAVIHESANNPSTLHTLHAFPPEDEGYVGRDVFLSV